MKNYYIHLTVPFFIKYRLDGFNKTIQVHVLLPNAVPQFCGKARILCNNVVVKRMENLRDVKS